MQLELLLQQVQTLDLSKSTSDLSEGTNQYYTEARVQDKLDNAFEQLRAMLNNLATSTTLTLGLMEIQHLVQLLQQELVLVVAEDSQEQLLLQPLEELDLD